MQTRIDEQLSRAADHAGSRSRVHVIYRPLSELKLDPKNPRAHSPRQVRQIARSIQTFGFNVPVLVDAKHKVIAGHGRILACQLVGWTEVPTICLDHLSEAQAKAFMIADNRLTENSVWDCTSSEPFGQVSNRFKRGSGPSELNLWLQSGDAAGVVARWFSA
jgi:hypothetical protein